MAAVGSDSAAQAGAAQTQTARITAAARPSPRPLVDCLEPPEACGSSVP